jgi:hypothetical protein
MTGRNVRDAEIALVQHALRAYRAITIKNEDGISIMNNHGIFAAYSGMLDIASRREAGAVSPAPRKRRGFAARLFRFR